jgi:hypothetical protein
MASGSRRVELKISSSLMSQLFIVGSTSDLIKTSAEIATFIAIAAATIVSAWQTSKVAQQTKLSLVTARATIYQGIMQEMLVIDRYFAKYPHLRQYFYEQSARELPTPNPKSYLAQCLEATAEMLVDFADTVYLQARNMQHEEAYPGEADLWVRWADYFHDLYENSSVLRQFVDERKRWLKPGLVEMLETGKFVAG